jgi:hypothetical protein
MGLSATQEATSCAATREPPSILWNPKDHYSIHKRYKRFVCLKNISVKTKTKKKFQYFRLVQKFSGSKRLFSKSSFWYRRIILYVLFQHQQSQGHKHHNSNVFLPGTTNHTITKFPILWNSLKIKAWVVPYLKIFFHPFFLPFIFMFLWTPWQAKWGLLVYRIFWQPTNQNSAVLKQVSWMKVLNYYVEQKSYYIVAILIRLTKLTVVEEW